MAGRVDMDQKPDWDWMDILEVAVMLVMAVWLGFVWWRGFESV